MAVSVEELCSHVGAHLVDLESREYFVGVAKRREKFVGEGVVVGLGEPLDGGGVDDS